MKVVDGSSCDAALKSLGIIILMFFCIMKEYLMILYDYLLLDDLFWTGSILLLSLLRRPTQRVGRPEEWAGVSETQLPDIHDDGPKNKLDVVYRDQNTN